MSKSFDKLWVVTMLSPSPGTLKAPEPITLRAETCDVEDGALIFRDGDHLSTKVIIAAGLWEMVEKEMEKSAND